MKIRPVLLAIAVASTQPLFAAAEPAPKPALSLYQQGVIAMEAGDPVLAETCFKNALKQDPNNANARFQLGEVQKNAASIAAKGREAKFGKVTIPKIQLEAASVRESLELISTLVAKESKDEISPNFVFEDPKSVLDSKQITIKLTNIPAKAALEYILSQAGAKARFDEHAIVIAPKS